MASWGGVLTRGLKPWLGLGLIFVSPLSVISSLSFIIMCRIRACCRFVSLCVYDFPMQLAKILWRMPRSLPPFLVSLCVFIVWFLSFTRRAKARLLLCLHFPHDFVEMRFEPRLVSFLPCLLLISSSPKLPRHPNPVHHLLPLFSSSFLHVVD